MSSIRVGAALAVFVACTVASAGSITIDFESLSEGDVVTNQYSSLGVLVGGSPEIFTAGSMLNEIDFPPHSGTNVLVDVGGPITFTFASPVLSVGGYFTYTTWLTLEAFSPTGTLLQTAASSSGANFGGPGSNEFIGFTSAAGDIGSFLIIGDPLGSSFTLDDLTYTTPEPSSGILMIIASAMLICFLGIKRRRFVAARSGIRTDPARLDRKRVV